MAVHVKDLYGNSGKRLKKINTRLEFSMKDTLPFLLYLFLLAMWLFSRSIADALVAIQAIHTASKNK